MLGATRDQAFTRSFGEPPPTIRPDAGVPQFLNNPGMSYDQQVAAMHTYTPSVAYIPINLSIAKSYVIHPTNQGQRAAIAQRQTMMFEPRGNPARSQVSQGYTAPAQLFEATNTWNTPTGKTSRGKRRSQPSVKDVSPFSRLPITTRMPWDL
jgi:hypothetical protein